MDTGRLAEPALGARLLTAVAAGVDATLVAAARAVIDRTIMPPPDAADALRQSAAFYLQPAFLDEPARFFAFLGHPVVAPEVTVTPRGGGAGFERLGLAFPSTYRPADPSHAADYAAAVENHKVHVELWRHTRRRARGTVIALHGFGMGYPSLDATVLMAPALVARGLDVALFALPLHGPRTPRTARFSGQVFAQPSVPQINEAMGQAAHDLAALVAWLRAQRDGAVGVLGLSLGGYVAALAAAVLGDLDFAIPVVAPVCLGDLAHRFMSTSRQYRGANGAALTREEFRAAYRVHSPLAHRPRLPRERLLIVAARGDRVVPAEHAHWLWAHWGEPRLTWFTGSHVVPFGRARVLAEIETFLGAIGVG